MYKTSATVVYDIVRHLCTTLVRHLCTVIFVYNDICVQIFMWVSCVQRQSIL